jgi:predicted ester cyclase
MPACEVERERNRRKNAGQAGFRAHQRNTFPAFPGFFWSLEILLVNP